MFCKSKINLCLFFFFSLIFSKFVLFYNLCINCGLNTPNQSGARDLICQDRFVFVCGLFFVCVFIIKRVFFHRNFNVSLEIKKICFLFLRHVLLVNVLYICCIQADTVPRRKQGSFVTDAFVNKLDSFYTSILKKYYSFHI